MNVRKERKTAPDYVLLSLSDIFIQQESRQFSLFFFLRATFRGKSHTSPERKYFEGLHLNFLLFKQQKTQRTQLNAFI